MHISKRCFTLKLKFYDFAFVSLIVATVSIYLFGRANLANFSLYFFSAAIVPLAALYMLKRWRRQDRTKQLTVFSIFLGFFLWLLAEVIWATYIFVLGVKPYPSVADALWIAGYCFMGVTFYSIEKWTRYSKKIRLRILNNLTSLGLGILVLLTVIMPIITGIEAVSLENVIDLTYPILDVVLFALVFGAFLALIRTDLWSTWVWIPLGFISYLIGDIGFAMLNMNGAYFDGHMIEVFWIIGNLGVAFGCLRVGMRSFDFRRFLETRTPTASKVPLQEKPFTKNLGLNVKGNVILMDYNPTSHYEKPVQWFLTEFSPAIIFTRRTSVLYDVTEKASHKILVFSEQVSVPKIVSENEVWIPPKSTSLTLDALNQTLEANRNDDEAGLAIVFDSLTDMTLLIGFQKTYDFLRNALDMIQAKNVTALFLINPEAHPKEYTSAFRSLFNSQISFKDEKLHPIKILKVAQKKSAEEPQDKLEAHAVQ